LYSPEAESSPATSFVDPAAMAAQLAVGGVGGVVVGGLGVAKPTSRTSSFEIENLLKTAEQVSAVPENRWYDHEEEGGGRLVSGG